MAIGYHVVRNTQLIVIEGLLLLSTIVRRLHVPKQEVTKHLTLAIYVMSFFSLYFMIDFIAKHHTY
ncbi:hypothetical protein VCO01S_33150 [Vibrio comitans NBRC 102076]|uniref:Uncharacterized protein n=1 Tax=Vibrio comitans NBRC 102076 TaxID=1219078 RepID=A0A4Y3ISM0_9VIBR|nr:hypothetical protein VCO01S_33150 [Vibrio comitans NBRC 102076]